VYTPPTILSEDDLPLRELYDPEDDLSLTELHQLMQELDPDSDLTAEDYIDIDRDAQWMR